MRAPRKSGRHNEFFSDKLRALGRSRWAWGLLFLVWGFFLSGVVAQWFGPPGMVQAVRLRSLLVEKQAEVQRLENEILRLQADVQRLEKSRYEQEREIRKTLGYAAKDEIIFDFSSAERVRRSQPSPTPAP